MSLRRDHEARIQRWFRIHRWRRRPALSFFHPAVDSLARFVEVSVRQIGWLGSLAWLQEQNQLYGTELADKEDVRRETLRPLKTHMIYI